MRDEKQKVIDPKNPVQPGKERLFSITIPDMPAQVAAVVGDCLSLCPVQQIAEEGRKLRLMAADVLKQQATSRIIVPGKGVH